MALKNSMKAFFRDFATEVLSGLQLTGPLISNQNLLTVLTFHRVLPEELRKKYPLPVLVTTPDELEWVLKYCVEQYSCGSLAAKCKEWREGKADKKPHLAITFDDGQEDNYRYALPVLEKLGVSATFFVPVEHINSGDLLWHDIVGFFVMKYAGSNHPAYNQLLQKLEIIENIQLSKLEKTKKIIRKIKTLTDKERDTIVNELNQAYDPKKENVWSGLMSWSQLEELTKKGHEVGSHSMTHPILTTCEIPKLKFEIETSRKILEENLHVSIQSFCFPNGDFDERILDIVSNAGYLQAVNTKWQANHQKTSMFQLGRCDIDPIRLMDRHGNLLRSRLEYRLSKLKRSLEK